MFDDNSGCEAGQYTTDRLNTDEQQVYEHVQEYGPIATASLQADLFPYDWETFEVTLASLARDGYLTVSENRVEVTVDLDGLTVPWTVEVSGLERTVTLRPASRGDLPAVAELGRTVGESGPADLPNSMTRLFASDRIQRLSGDWRVVLVAAFDGRVTGWAHLWAEEGQEVAELAGGVARGDRRNGIGSNLHEYALEWAEHSGYRRLAQSLPAADAESCQFLRKRGWSVEGVPGGRGDGDACAHRLRLVTDLG